MGTVSIDISLDELEDWSGGGRFDPVMGIDYEYDDVFSLETRRYLLNDIVFKVDGREYSKIHHRSKVYDTEITIITDGQGRFCRLGIYSKEMYEIFFTGFRVKYPVIIAEFMDDRLEVYLNPELLHILPRNMVVSLEFIKEELSDYRAILG